MATHSSTLAWKIPWTEEPGRLQSMGSLGVRYDWVTSLSLYHFWYPVATSLGEGNGTPLQSSCLENPMDGGAWQAAVHGVAKSWTQLSNFTFTFHFHALEKEMATHSSVLAWRIPRTAEPGGLPSMGSYRVGHDWSDLAVAIAVYDFHLLPPSFDRIIVFFLTCLCKILSRTLLEYFSFLSRRSYSALSWGSWVYRGLVVENQGILILLTPSLVIFSHLPQLAAESSVITLLWLFLEYLFSAPNT